MTLAIALVLVGLLSLGQLVDAWDPEEPFRDEQVSTLSALAEDVPRSLTLSRAGRFLVITNPDEIRQFLAILIDAQHLEYHHSHPQDEFLVDFAGHSGAYTLGRDSKNPDEYWLQLDSGSNSSPTIKLFRSPSLAEWLVRNGAVP